MQTSSSQTFPFPEVRVVEASAGSGKTFALAKRYVQLLLNPALAQEQVLIRTILAITFTNKAAIEMKSRILQFLKKIVLRQLDPLEQKQILEPLEIGVEQASLKAATIMEELIHHYNFFQVQTIDSFINALLSGCAFKLDLTANFRIKTNSAEYLEYSLDQLIDRANKDKRTKQIFEHFLHNYLYLENRTGWFPKKDILAIIRTLFSQHNHYGLNFLESDLGPEDLLKRKRITLEDMRQLQKLLPEGTHATFVKNFSAFLEEHAGGFDIDSISSYFAREEIPLRKGVEVSPEAQKLWEKIRSDLRQLCSLEARSLFNPYIQIFNQAQEIFREVAIRDDVLFLEELNKRASALFDEDYVTVQELYYRLATRFRHYLLDEFQDTSRLQWYNVEKMVEEALSTGGSLFYVGDRKQAIFSFRGGDIELFDEVKGKFTHFNVRQELLQDNWRSEKAIVEFNNQIFSIENLTRFLAEKEAQDTKSNNDNAVTFGAKDLQELAKLFGTAKQSVKRIGDGGYVHVEYIDIDKREERDAVVREKVIGLVKDLVQRFQPRDIAFLVRTRNQVEELTSWLLEEGILVESERTSNIQENKLIQELVAFLQFLDSPIDNLSFATFILGELFPRATGLKSEELHRFVFRLRERLKNEKDLYLYTEFRQQFPDVWSKFLDEFFRNVGLYPLYELLVSVYFKFNCLQLFAEYQGFLMHFLELVKKKEEDHSDITSFLEYFAEVKGEELYVQVADSNAVRILTIHKSKGLEFPVTIIPFLGLDIQVGSHGDDNKQSYVLRKEKDAMELLRLKDEYYKFCDELKEIYDEEYKKALFTELNNVYVALTRAQKELHVFIPKRVRNSYNPARFLIPEQLYEQGKPTVQKPAAQKPVERIKLPVSNYQDWIGYLRDEFLVFDEFRNRPEKLKGSIMHAILAGIKNLHQVDTHAALQAAVESASTQLLEKIEWKEYAHMASQIIHAPALKHFFFIEGGEVLTELDVVDVYGQTRRIDRLIVKEKEIWVVDYKSSADSEVDYHAQVSDYMKIIAGLYPRRSIKGFLIYLDKSVSEEVVLK